MLNHLTNARPLPGRPNNPLKPHGEIKPGGPHFIEKPLFPGKPHGEIRPGGPAVIEGLSTPAKPGCHAKRVMPGDSYVPRPVPRPVPPCEQRTDGSEGPAADGKICRKMQPLPAKVRESIAEFLKAHRAQQ